jgi:hypothetical protein
LIAIFYWIIDFINSTYHVIAFRVPVEPLWPSSGSEWKAINEKRVHKKGKRMTTRPGNLGAVVLVLVVLTLLFGSEQQAEAQQRQTSKFKGVIKTDIRDSTPDWAPFTPAKAPVHRPRVFLDT